MMASNMSESDESGNNVDNDEEVIVPRPYYYQRPLYLRQEGESCNAYSDQFLSWHHQNFPVLGRYARATTPFRAEDVLTHIANCAC